MTATSVLPQAVPLSVALREGTRGEHEAAERSGFVELPAVGRASTGRVRRPRRPAAGRLHRARGGRRRGWRTTAGWSSHELARVPAIEQDLAFLYGADWRTQVRVLPATQAYVRPARAGRRTRSRGTPRTPTRATSATCPAARSSSGCCSGTTASTADGIAFYDFPEIHKLKPFKDVYRERLDALPLDDERPRGGRRGGAATPSGSTPTVFGELGAVHVR